MLKQVVSPRLRFLRNQICHEHSVDPGISRCRGKWLRAELQERIEITEENNGYIDLLPDVPRTREHVVDSHAVSQRPFRRALNHFPTRDRITTRPRDTDT